MRLTVRVLMAATFALLCYQTLAISGDTSEKDNSGSRLGEPAESSTVSPALEATIDRAVNALGNQAIISTETQREILRLLSVLDNYQLVESNGKLVQQRHVAYQDLMGYGEVAIPVFLSALKDPDKRTRINALRALQGVLTDRRSTTRRASFLPAVKDCLPVYFELLNDQEQELREMTISALGSIGQSEPDYRPAIIPGLVKLLDDPNQSVARSASEALARMGWHLHQGSGVPEDREQY